MFTGRPSFIQVTFVAGEPVEVQVRGNGSRKVKSMFMILGVAVYLNKPCNKFNMNYYRSCNLIMASYS